MSTAALHVAHEPGRSRFVADVDGAEAVCIYRRDGDVMAIVHTEVPPAAQGRGIAGAVVAAALDWARREGLRVRPLCSYVAAYMRRHRETQDLLA